MKPTPGVNYPLVIQRRPSTPVFVLPQAYPRERGNIVNFRNFRTSHFAIAWLPRYRFNCINQEQWGRIYEECRDKLRTQTFKDGVVYRYPRGNERSFREHLLWQSFWRNAGLFLSQSEIPTLDLIRRIFEIE